MLLAVLAVHECDNMCVGKAAAEHHVPSSEGLRLFAVLCSLSGAMDEFSVVDELSVTLMFLNPFLAKLPEEAREGLCRHMSIENISRDHTIYKQGDEVPNFYLILSGQCLSTCVFSVCISTFASSQSGAGVRTFLLKGSHSLIDRFISAYGNVSSTHGEVCNLPIHRFASAHGRFKAVH